MIRALGLIVCLLAGLIATAEEVDRQKLISLLEFPVEHVSVAFRFTMTNITIMGSEKDSEQQPDLPAQIKAFEEKLLTNPRNPDLHLQLGYLYDQNSRKDLADRMFQEALDLYQARFKSGKRNDPELVVGLASALEAVQRREEAATLIRQELKRSPRVTRYWAALGENLFGSIVIDLTKTNNSTSISDPNILYAAAMKQKLPADQLSAMRASYKEASKCFGRAISQEPKNADLYRQRMTTRAALGMALDIAESDKSQDSYQTAFKASIRSILGDMRTIAQLSPRDPDAISARMLGEMMVGAFSAPQDFDPGNLDSFPAETEASIRKGIEQLRALVKKKNIPHKATAFASIGFFEFMLGKKAEGKAALRHAIDLNPQMELGWELLLTLFSIDENWRDMLNLCREKARYQNSARIHSVAAKAAEHLKDYPQAKAEITKALELEPKDFNANLAFAISLLRENSSQDLEKSGVILDELAKRPDLTPAQWRDLMIPGGVSQAFSGQNDSAKEWFDALLKNYPDDENAKAALAAFKN